MPRGLEVVNISRAATVTNLFYLFFHGGKSAVVPFITLFFRLLGLSAFQVGIIIAAKTLTGLVWAPLWARCAAAYNRQRFILMFSLFMMIITNLSFPALYTILARPEHCSSPVSNSTVNGAATTPHGLVNITLKPLVTVPSTVAMNTTTMPVSTVSTARSTTTSTTPIPTRSTSATVTNGSTTVSPYEGIYNEVLKMLPRYKLTPAKIIGANMTVHKMYELVHEVIPDSNISEHIIGVLYKMLVEREGATHPRTEKDTGTKYSRQRRSAWLRDMYISVQNSLQSDKTFLCLVILTIVIAGELFASPVEKVADDSWFDFLNRIDDLERYGQQRFWGSFAFVIVPVIVTIAVDHSPCFLPFHLHHFLLHFYVLAVLMGAALVIACCYPIPPPASSRYPNKVSKALKAICCDGRGFLFTTTLLFGGMVFASFHNFLFWRIQDLGGSESTMGLCVSAAAFAEIPMLILSTRFVKKLGNGWAVSLTLFILSVRVACYSVIPSAWAFIPIELSHGITHTMMWFSILSYDDFNVGASIDRSIRSILSSFYFGVGFSIGSLISGYLYTTYGAQVLYWSASAFTLAWWLIFSLVQRCLPRKEKIRYIKLLRSDSDNSDDNDDDDDWLEMALKEK